MATFTLSTVHTASTTDNEALSLVWWPVFATILGMVAGMAVAQALTGDLSPLLGLSLALTIIPVMGWVAEVWPNLEEISNFVLGGYVPPVCEEVSSVPNDRWALGMLEDEMAEEEIEMLPEWAILPLPAPLPRLPRSSREVLTDLLRKTALQDEDDFDMHAEACKDFIWV